MKLNNIGLGVLVLFLALALGIAGAQLPNPSRQIYGPGFFPLLLSVLLAINALFLIAGGVRHRGVPLFEVQPWARMPILWLRFAAIPLSVAFYILCVGFLGFLPTVFVLLAALFLLLGVRWAVAVPVAAVTALVVHSLFYLGLRVQLPWGLLESIRW